MKKILFVINNLETGGVQTSLLNLVKEIHDDYEVSIVVFFYKEEYETLVPENVKIVKINSPFKHFGMSKQDIYGHGLLYVERAFWLLLCKLLGRSMVIRFMSPWQKKLQGYDVVISYLHEGPQGNLYGGCNEFVLKKLVAKKKVTWIHCDFGLSGANNAQSRKIYEKFDDIIACSEGSKDIFIKCIPELKEKCTSIRNCNDYEKINALAKDAVEYDKEYFNVVTVARLSKEKGIERAIESVRYCIDRGYKIKYHIIGEGDQEKFLKNLASNMVAEDYIVFYGKQSNPYKYMVNADLFLLPSYHEAAPMVFDEAACLGVPVLTTKTTSTEEMIVKNYSGIVCENSTEGIKQKLEELLRNQSLLREIKTALLEKQYDNKNIVEQFRIIVNE